MTDTEALDYCIVMLNSAETRLSATQDTLTVVRTVGIKKARRTGFKWGVGVTTVAAIVLGLAVR